MQSNAKYRSLLASLRLLAPLTFLLMVNSPNVFATNTFTEARTSTYAGGTQISDEIAATSYHDDEHAAAAQAIWATNTPDWLGPRVATSGANAYSDHGVIKNYAQANSTEFTSAYAESRASYSDTFVFDSESRNGQWGYTYVTLRATWSFIATPVGYTDARYGIGFSVFDFFSPPSRRDNFEFVTGLTCSGDGCDSWSNYTGASQGYNEPEFAEPLIILKLNFLFGTDTSFGLSTFASATANWGGYASVDSSHSNYWAGFGNVYDSDGNLVTDYKFSSVSGTNYFQDFSASAVPEPQGIVMLLAGLGLLGMNKRGKKQT